MPFRAKVKKALGGGTSSPSDGSAPNKSFLNKTSARRPLKSVEERDWPANVYKPGEVMPRPKYRGPWNQAHQDKLSAFSFGSSRRKSDSTVRTGSEYSPMGSKLPSRGTSRRNSSISWSSLKGAATRRRGMGSRQSSGFGQNREDRLIENGEGDDDIANVGLSRQHTAEPRPLPFNGYHEQGTEGLNGLQTQRTLTNGNGFLGGSTDELENQRTITNGQLFTEEELAKAMTASTLKPSRKLGI